VIGVDEAGQLYVLTNRHVVYHELTEGQHLSFDVELEAGVRIPAVLDYYSRSHDLALLVIPGITGWALPVPLLPRHQLRVGQHVYAVGSPIGLDDSFTSGVISALRAEHIQTDATVHLGSSGGPLFDASGMMCGVVTTTHQQKDLSFALYADFVFELLADRMATRSSAVTSPESELTHH
jgi:2-alkenal reductase